MNINVQDITITNLETIMAVDIVTGDFMFTMDELQNATIAQTQEVVPITGKAGRRLNSLKRNKAVTISGTNGLVSAGLLELQSGGSFEEKLTTVKWTDTFFATSNTSATNFVAVGTAGNEIGVIFVKNSDGTLGESLTQGAAVGSGVFTYDPTTKKIEFDADEISDNTELVAFYDRRIKANVLDNFSDNFSGKCALYIDALGEDSCANIYRIQFYIPKADFDGNFDIAMGDSQTVHAFSAEALAGACGTAGLFWTYTIFGAEAIDE